MGNELALMLSGLKPMAYFPLAYFPMARGMDPRRLGDDAFAPYVDSGQIVKFVEHYRNRRTDRPWR